MHACVLVTPPAELFAHKSFTAMSRGTQMLVPQAIPTRLPDAQEGMAMYSPAPACPFDTEHLHEHYGHITTTTAFQFGGVEDMTVKPEHSGFPAPQFSFSEALVTDLGMPAPPPLEAVEPTSNRRQLDKMATKTRSEAWFTPPVPPANPLPVVPSGLPCHDHSRRLDCGVRRQRTRRATSRA